MMYLHLPLLLSLYLILYMVSLVCVGMRWYALVSVCIRLHPVL